CANASAGYMCCAFLILMGVFSKFGTLFLMIPDAVLGGMTTFLFANVASSGMRILAFLKQAAKIAAQMEEAASGDKAELKHL
ncbi:hypothetical protein BGZ68_000473, partial [Mortierella alpina]